MRAGAWGVELLYCTYLETVVEMSITFLFLVALHTYYSRVLGLVGGLGCAVMWDWLRLLTPMQFMVVASSLKLCTV